MGSAEAQTAAQAAAQAAVVVGEKVVAFPARDLRRRNSREGRRTSAGRHSGRRAVAQVFACLAG